MRLTSGLVAWMRMQSKPDVWTGTVPRLMVETGALCHLKCPVCPTGNGQFGLSREFLSLEDFRLMLGRLSPGVETLLLYNKGEPLLNPELDGMIREASRRGIKVCVNTSLSIEPFHAGDAERLMGSGLFQLTVSCDGTTQRTYELYRAGGRLELVLRNLRLLAWARARVGTAPPHVVWRFLVHGGNQHEMEAACALAEELGVPIRFSWLLYPEEESGRWAADPAGPGRFDLLRQAHPTSEELSEDVCLQLWDTPVLHSDGTVMPCCTVTDPRYALGNLLRQPFEEAWNAPLAVSMRRYLRTGRREAADLPCYRCPLNPERRPAR